MKYISFLILSFIFCLSGMAAASDHSVLPIQTKQPEEKKLYPIAIIGAGAAGTMAVKRAILNNQDTLLFVGAKQEMRRSRGTWVRQVDNIPGLAKYERTILQLRNETLQELSQTAFKDHLYVIDDSVVLLEKDANHFKLTDGAGRIYLVKYVVLATGMMDEQPHIQGSIRPILKYANGQTVAYCAICDGHRSIGKKSIVIGFSESAANTAILLSEKYQLQHMTILTNGHAPQFNPNQMQRMKTLGIEIKESAIQEVLGEKEKKQLTGFKLENEETVEAEIGFVSLGVRPNNQLALQLGAQIDAVGLVVTDPNGETSVPNLFVIGDLRSNSMKQIYTAWQHAVDSLQVISKRIRESNNTPQLPLQ